MSSPEEAFDPTSASAFVFDEAPASAILRSQPGAGPWQGLPTERLEIVSRGDLVNGLLVSSTTATATSTSKAKGKAPANAARPGLLLLAHDAGGSVQSKELGAVADWLGPSLALAAIDLPLHGHRASPKLSERLVGAIATRARSGALDSNGAVLVEEFLRQAVADWRRTLDALLALERFDAKRIGFLGLGLGAWIGGAWLAGDERVGAAILAGRRTAPMPVAPYASAAATQVRVLDVERSTEPWTASARPFFASSLGF